MHIPLIIILITLGISNSLSFQIPQNESHPGAQIYASNISDWVGTKFNTSITPILNNTYFALKDAFEIKDAEALDALNELILQLKNNLFVRLQSDLEETIKTVSKFNNNSNYNSFNDTILDLESIKKIQLKTKNWIVNSKYEISDWQKNALTPWITSSQKSNSSNLYEFKVISRLHNWKCKLRGISANLCEIQFDQLNKRERFWENDSYQAGRQFSRNLFRAVGNFINFIIGVVVGILKFLFDVIY